MANVASTLAVDIDRRLDDLTERWSEIPAVAREIESWDLIEQIDWAEEWAIQEDRLRDIQARIGTIDPLTPRGKRFTRLMALVNEHRETIRLLRS